MTERHGYFFICAMALTAKRKRFVDEYLVDRIGAKAYVRAGYKAKNANVAAIEAHRMLKDPEVRAAIDAAEAARQERVKFDADRVLLELQRMALFDPRKLFGPDGTPLPISELDDDTAAAIAGLDVLEEYSGSGKDRTFIGYTKKYKLADKMAAIQAAMRHFGMFKDRVEHTGEGGGPIKVEDGSNVEVARRIAFLLSAGVADVGTKH